MAALEIAIELGTSNTAIFLDGTGLVLFEPSVAAVTKTQRRDKTKHFGMNAIQNYSENPDKTLIISPIDNGLLLDSDMCSSMLKEFLKRLISKKAIFNPKFNAILNVPLGLNDKERAMFESVCYRAGVSDVVLIESILSSAVGMDLPISSEGSFCVVNMGGGKVDIAVISECRIVEGCSLNLGGNLLDIAITEYVEYTHGVAINRPMSLIAKHNIASLYPNDTMETQVSGFDLKNNKPTEVVLKSMDIYNVILPYFEKIVDGIKSVLNNCPAGLVSDIQNNGIYICGGNSVIPGLDLLFKSMLNANVWLVENPMYTAISGAGKLLYYDELYGMIVKRI